METSELLVVAGMVVTLLPTAIGGALVWGLKLVDRQATTEERRAAEEKSRQDTLEGRVCSLEKSDRTKTIKIERLEDKVRDQDGLIQEATPVMIWIGDGAHPPAPTLEWRWLQHLRDRRTTHTPQQAPPPAGPSS